jgi:CheY-like chemotaxis protein
LTTVTEQVEVMVKASDSSCATMSAPASKAELERTLLRVAVLDDDEDVVDSIATVLRMQGLEAQEFTGQAELMAALRETHFDAYVLDWLLGDVTALDIVIRLRTDLADDSIPIFLLSGNLALGGIPTDPVLAAAIAEHRLFYRAKPYSTRKLARDIQVAYEGGIP